MQMFDVPFLCNNFTSICFIKDILDSPNLKQLSDVIMPKIDEEQLKTYSNPPWGDAWKDRCILLSTKYSKEQSEGNSVDLKKQVSSKFKMACFENVKTDDKSLEQEVMLQELVELMSIYKFNIERMGKQNTNAR